MDETKQSVDRFTQDKVELFQQLLEFRSRAESAQEDYLEAEKRFYQFAQGNKEFEIYYVQSGDGYVVHFDIENGGIISIQCCPINEYEYEE